MINYSSAFKRELFNDNRQYITQVIITTTDNTTMNIGNANLWEGGCSQEDAVSSDDDLQIGSAIINKCTIEINNIYGTYDEYDFSGASVSAYVGLNVDGLDELEKKGTYVVVDASYTDSAITLECYDYMSKLDVPFENTQISFPATLGEIVSGVCSECHVSLLNVNFPHYGYVIDEMPDLESCTYREVLAWAAQIAGCFARFNANGRLELKWYDRSTLETVMNDLDGGIFDSGDEEEYTTGDSADGGSFNPWNDGDNYDGGDFSNVNAHFISSAFSHSISVDDVVITGIRILVKIVDEENKDALATHLEGTEGYIIEISDNPFITEDNVDDIIEWLGIQLIGMTFRKANLSIPSDPSIEAGDVAIYWDRKGNYYPLIISRVNFTPGESQTIVSSAQTPARNSSQRFQVDTKNYVALKKQIQQQKTAWEEAEADLIDMIDEASGLFETDVTNQQTGKTIHYYHNKTLLSESDTRIMISDVGITFTANGTASQPTWYGLTIDGNYIANNLYAHGINADYITSGHISADRINVTDLRSIGAKIADFTINNDGLTYHGSYTDNGSQIPYSVYLRTGNNGQRDVIVVRNGTEGNYTYPFFLHADGYFAATNCSITGSITATSLTLTGTASISASKVSGLATVATTGSYDNLTNAPNKNTINYMSAYFDSNGKLTKGNPTQGQTGFEVSTSGLLTCTNAVVWGTVHASAGDIGGWTINQTSISRSNIELGNGYIYLRLGTYKSAVASISNSGVAELKEVSCHTLSAGVSNGKTVLLANDSGIYIETGTSTIASGAVYLLGVAVSGSSNYKVARAASSIRYKDVSRKMNDSDVEAFYNVIPVIAKYKDDVLDKSDEMLGRYMPMIIAEDVDSACYEAAIHNQNKQVEDWNPHVLIPVHQQMLISQNNKINSLKQEIDKLKKEIKQLKAVS